MNNPFCQNKLCRAYVEATPGVNRLVLTAPDCKVVEIRQIQIYCDGREFKFCEICANAAAIIWGKKN